MIHASLLEVSFVGGALFIASNLWFFFRVLSPLQRLSRQAAQLSEGELDSLEQHCGGIPEVSQLRRAMAGMVGHVRRAQEQSRVYAEKLADGQENERKRIARELHDETVQSIIGVTQGIDMAQHWVKTDPEQALKMLQLAREQAVEVVTNLRNLIGGLRPPALEELGLIAALQMQIEELEHPTVQVDIVGEPRRLTEIHELALFRIAQETLTNVCRHSQADHVNITVAYAPDGVTLRVKDDGVGFRVPVHLGELAFKNHYGLLGIQERVASLGGMVRLDSQPGAGTTVQVYLPAAEQPQPDDRVRDPVCRALIEPHRAYGSSVYQDKTYYFCCPVCQGAFQQNPELYLREQSASNTELSQAINSA